MKINTTNRAALSAAVAEANGQARAHTASAHDVALAAVEAESTLADFGLPVSARPGASAAYVSGDTLPNSYAYLPIRTHVILVRGSRDWFARFIGAYQGDAKSLRVELSQEQLETAQASRMRAHNVARKSD